MKPILLALGISMLGATMLPLQAQDLPANEIALQFGGVVGQGRFFTSQALPGRTLSQDGGLAGGIAFNHRMVGGGRAALYFHLPFFAYQNRFPATSIFGNSVSGDSSWTGFVTPGVMLRFFESHPIQPYVFGGVGYAQVAQLVPNQGLDSVQFNNNGTWGVSSGGGLDIMFTRHFGVRGEGRALTTGSSGVIVPGLTLTDSNTRFAATGGLVFRW